MSYVLFLYYFLGGAGIPEPEVSFFPWYAFVFVIMHKTYLAEAVLGADHTRYLCAT